MFVLRRGRREQHKDLLRKRLVVYYKAETPESEEEGFILWANGALLL